MCRTIKKKHKMAFIFKLKNQRGNPGYCSSSSIYFVAWLADPDIFTYYRSRLSPTVVSSHMYTVHVHISYWWFLVALYNSHARYIAVFSQRLSIRTHAHIALLSYRTCIFENHSLTPSIHAHVGIIDHMIYKYIHVY